MMNFSMRQLTACVATAAVAGVCVPASQAAIVTITSGANAGVVVFDSGGYEGAVAGALPATSSPAVGSLEFNDTDGVMAATGAGQDGLTAAFAGSNYLSIDRGAVDASSNSWVNHIFAQGIDATSEDFQLEVAVWGSTDYLAMGLGGPGTDLAASGAPDLLAGWGYHTTQGFRDYGNGATLYNGWVVGEWNTILFQWDHENEVATLTVNGTVNTMDSTDDPIGTVSQFHARANSSGNQLYLDTVPEPGSMALVSIGGLVMLLRKRSA